MAGDRPAGDQVVPCPPHAPETEQEIDRAQPIRSEELLQVSPPQRARRGETGAERQHSEAGEISPGLSRSRADRTAFPVRRAQGARGEIRGCEKLRDSGAVLLDGDAVVG